MASEVPSMPVNGNYVPHQVYGSIDQQNSYAYNTNIANQASLAQASPAAATPSKASPAQAEISKDEVGWYFVEQYYTTLSRNPDKLYLFYAKRSQFVSGQETDKVQVCIGQRAIDDKIRQLDFQDCKVRVTNVDSQSSDSNIVIQVIGEISNKSQPHKKFVQTFVLATQTNGYFVLNDIFRYLIEEEDEPETAAAPALEGGQQAQATSGSFEQTMGKEADRKTLTSSTDPAAVERDAKQVDKELEEKALNGPSVAIPTATPANGEAASEAAETDKVEAAPTTIKELEPPKAAEIPHPKSTEADLTPEKPKDPEPTPAVTPPKQTTLQPAPVTKPAAPKTWANLAAAANKVATPVPPQSVTPPSSVSSRPAPPVGKPATPTSTAGTIPPAPPAVAAPATAAAASQPSVATQRQDTQGSDSQDEWTAVGSSHSRQQSRQANNAQQDAPQYRGYIKNVHEGVDQNELRSALEKFGELVYFDVARQKVSHQQLKISWFCTNSLR